MVNHSAARLDATFGALAHPARRAILHRLAQGEAAVTELAKPFAMTLPAISKHLGVLERAGLVVRERDGRTRRCRLVANPMREAAGWIERYSRFWEGRLDGLARYLSDSTAEERTQWPPSGPPRPSASPASSRRRPKASSRRGPDRNS
jgi:DNA-binding transcriptional ArsR family regulator